MRDAVVIDKNGEIISGNHRKKAATKKGITKERIIEATSDEVIAIQYKDVDLSTPEGKELALALNQTAKFNINIDEEVAIEELGEVVEEWGIEIPEEIPEASEDDFDTTPPENPITVLGDLYEIGEHRLLCGDSTDSDQVAKLMNGEKADMVFTDPPYGMNLDTNYANIYINTIAKVKNQDKIIGDDKDFNFIDFYALFEYVKEQFWWGADYYQNQLPSNGGIFVWDKVCESLEGRIGNEFELCWSKQRHKKEIIHIKWAGFLGLQKEDGKRQHPTQKPIRLCESFISRFSKESNLLIDPFLGSGSTMVAAHQLKRKCYGMELDCKYVDVIVKRMLTLDKNITVKRNGVDCKSEFIND
jgi:DNA modification methylase